MRQKQERRMDGAPADYALDGQHQLVKTAKNG
jgi:hypothetical protein